MALLFWAKNDQLILYNCEKNALLGEDKVKTVLEEINKLRNCNTCDFEKENTNRYCLIAKEQIGRTAYCFSAPIYSSSSNRLVSREFKQTGQAYYFDGSNSRITIINNCIVFKNELGSVSVKVAEDNYSLGNDGLSNNKSSIKPTLRKISKRYGCRLSVLALE